MKGMEYEEVTIPENVQVRAEKLSQMDQNNPKNLTTMTNTGFIEWLNERGQEGWRIVWSQLRQPFVVFEREVVVEEVKK